MRSWNISDVLSHMQNLKSFGELEMSVYHSLFLDFSILGGMPAVRVLCDNNRFHFGNNCFILLPEQIRKGAI